MKHKIAVQVNGKSHEHEVAPRQLLVHYLRENLGLTGTHVGCDTSQCGACTVVVNGLSVKSCTMLAVQANGAEIPRSRAWPTTAPCIPCNRGSGKSTAFNAGSARRAC